MLDPRSWSPNLLINFSHDYRPNWTPFIIFNVICFSGVLEVQLLDTANISVESLSDDEEFHGEDSSVFLFANVFLTPQVRNYIRVKR